MIELKVSGKSLDDLTTLVGQINGLLDNRQQEHARTQEMMRLSYDAMRALLLEFAKIEPVTEWLLEHYGESRLQDVPIYYWPEIADYWAECIGEAANGRA